MGWSIKYPLGKNSSISNAVTQVFSIPVNVGSAVSSNVVSLGKNINLTALDVKKDINKGEIGKLTSNLADSFYNLKKAPLTLIDVATGKKSAGTEIQKLAGSAYNQQTLGLSAYLGQSSGYQEVLTNRTVKDLTLDYSANLAGKDSAVFSTSRTGTLSSADKNDVFEWFGKTAAIGGGIGLYQYLTTPQPGALAAAGEGGAGPILVDSGTPLVEPTVTSTNIGLGASEGAAAASAGWSSYLPSANTLGTGALAYGVLSGKTPPGAALSVLNPGLAPSTGSFIDDLLNPIFGGGGDNGGGSSPGFQMPSVISAPVRSVLPELSETQASVLSMVALGAVGFFIYKKVS